MSEHKSAAINELRNIAVYADDLIKSIGTPDAVRLAAFTLWNAQQPEKCLAILTDHIDKFPGNVLPNDLSRLKVYCQAKVGNLSSAIREAEDLLHRDNSTENLVTLMELRRQSGDLKGIVIDARTIINREDVSPHILLHIGRLVKFEDPNLAKDFWHRAKDKMLNDPAFLAELITQGFELGLDDEVGPLFIQVQKFAEKSEGPIRPYNISQFSSWAKERGEFLKDVNENYAKGVAPVHLVASAVNVPLADIFHGIPEQNRKELDPIRQLCTFSRHGGKSVQEAISKKSNEWRLHIDITALLLAADIEILKQVEKCFKPLWISKNTIESFIHQRDQLNPQQPSNIIDNRNIIKLLEQGKFKLFPEEINAPQDSSELSNKMGQKWGSILKKARLEKGFLVDYLPITSNDVNQEPVTLPVGVSEFVINCRALTDSLKGNGYLSDVQYKKALSGLGHEAAKIMYPQLPQIGSSLFLMGNIASVLEGAGLLESVCNNFRVLVDPIQVQWAKSELVEHERRAELGSWLKQISDHISLGLQNGVYQIVVPLEHEQDEEEAKERNPDFNSVRDLLASESKLGDVLWADDRLINSYSNKNGVPIIGINEVLLALHLRGELTEDEYYEKLLKLRAGNFRYIPVDSKEILYHLGKSQIGKGGEAEKPIETLELSTLRRYIASCLLDSERLQRPPMPQGANPYGEMAFVHIAVTAAMDSIVQVWADDNIPIDIAEARADWILRNLYTGVWGIQHLTPGAGPYSTEADMNRLGLDLGGMFVQGISLMPSLDLGKRTRRTSFFSWLDTRLASRRFKADPNVLTTTADFLKHMILSSSERYTDIPQAEELSRVIKQRWLLELPEDLRSILEADKEVLDWFHVPTSSVVEIGPFAFLSQTFWEALEGAFDFQEATVTDQATGAKLVLRRVEEGNADEVLIEVRNEQGEVVGRWTNELWTLLHKDKAKREAVLREKHYWFDCEQETLDREIREIASIDNVAARLERVMSRQNKSAEVFYRSLQRRLSRHEEVTWGELLPPSFDSLLRHYRFTIDMLEDRSFSDVLIESSDALLREEGVITTFERLICLPVRMPENLVEALSGLQELDRRKLFEKDSSLLASPVSALNLIDIALRLGLNDESSFETIQRALGELLDDSKGEPNFQLFKETINFVNDEFGYRYRDENVSAKSRLAMVWAHACRLHNIFHSASAVPEGLAKSFREYYRQISIELLSREPDYWNDILHPRRVKRVKLLTYGIARLLQDKDPQVLSEVALAERIRKMVFSRGVESNFPAVDLISDPTLKTNLLESYLGGDLAEMLAPLIGEDGLETLSPTVLHGLVSQALENLKEAPNSKEQWSVILALVGDSPIYQDLRESLITILETINIDSVYDADPMASRMALRVAANQLVYIDDNNLRSHFEESFLRVIGAEFGRNNMMEEDTGDDQNTYLLSESIEIAFALSAKLNDPLATSMALGKLLRKMINRIPKLANYYRHIIWRLVSELPVSQLQGLWTALLTVRASSKDALE